MKKYKIISIVLFLFAISNIFCDPYLAKRFNQSAKEKESKPDEIIAIIKSKITSEKTIVDLGAGVDILPYDLPKRLFRMVLFMLLISIRNI